MFEKEQFAEQKEPDPEKCTYCMIAFTENSWIGITNLQWQKVNQRFPGAWKGGRIWPKWGNKELSGMTGVFYILTVDVVKWAYTFVKIHQTVHLQLVQSTVCKLYVTEVGLKGKKED